MKDNNLVDDQTISSILQPKRQSPDKNGEEVAANVELVVLDNELPDAGLFSTLTFANDAKVTFLFFSSL